MKALFTLLTLLALTATAFAQPPDSLWSETFGGESYDGCNSVIQTEDGGFVLAGYTYSFGAGGYDFWLVKTDADGDSIWSKTFGGAQWEYAQSVIQTADGGFALAGKTNSLGAGDYDFWLVKTDADGNEIWSNTFGGASTESASSVVQTDDGGFILAGSTTSFGAGNFDFYLVKTDADGNEIWSNTFGGGSQDGCFSVTKTVDGGFALAGYTFTFGAGNYDFWLVKTDADGDSLWSKTFGGASSEYAYSVIQTDDGGLALAGEAYSFGAGNTDVWLVKTNADGDSLWSNTFGGGYADGANSVIQTDDGGFALAGHTESFAVSLYDFWLVKTDADGDSLWARSFGGNNYDMGYSVVQSGVNIFTMAGHSPSFVNDQEFWLVSTGFAEQLLPDWRMNIKAQVGALVDDGNYAGGADWGFDGFDLEYDFAESPEPPDAFIQLYFPHAVWAMPQGDNFNTDVVGLNAYQDTFKVWDFEVNTDQANQNVTLTFTQDAGFPANAYVFLYSVASDSLKRILPPNNRTFVYNSGAGGPFAFQLIIGTGPTNVSHAFNAGWNLASIPLVPDNPVAEDIIGDDEEGLYFLRSYTSALGYVDEDSVKHGTGYWLYLQNDATIDMAGVANYTRHTFTLQPGWNLIGAPFTGALSEDDIYFKKGAVWQDLPGAVTAGWVQNLFYGFQAGDGAYTDEATLAPWRGYWFSTLVANVVMYLDPIWDANQLQVDDGFELAADNWYLNISVAVATGHDPITRFGVAPNANDGFDAGYDYPEPPTPPAGSPVKAFFSHPGWHEALGSQFNTDICAPMTAGNVDEWELSVVAEQAGDVTLSWPELGETTFDWDFILEDAATHAVVHLQEVESYTYQAEARRPHLFNIRVEALGVGDDSGPALPAEFGLIGISPNPFNSRTAINFGLAAQGNAKLTVLDIQGRTVVTVLDNALKAGVHTAVWDAANVPTGLYLLRLESAGQTATLKASLIK